MGLWIFYDFGFLWYFWLILCFIGVVMSFIVRWFCDYVDLFVDLFCGGIVYVLYSW